MQPDWKHVVLIAEDDPDDRLLLQEAFVEARMNLDIRVVSDGEDLLNYLKHRGAYNVENAPRPSLILLDLNMPRIDGREALQTIKEDRTLRSIPIVVLTTSTAHEDIANTYKRGASAYIPKPASYQGLVQIVRTLGQFWFQTTILLPDSDEVHEEPAEN